MGNYQRMGKLFAVDVEIPASVMVKVENRCGRNETPQKLCSLFVAERVGATVKNAKGRPE